jgi:hypothetical protein
MLAAPLLYSTNVLITLIGEYNFGTFFHIYNNICPPLLKLTKALLRPYDLAPRPPPLSARSVSFLTDGRGRWVNLLNNDAANIKIF